MSTINSDEHSAKRYVRSEPGQPLATEQRDEPGAYCISTGQLRKSKGGDVKRVGASARRVNMTDRSSYQQDPMAPALGVVGGTPGWAVRKIIPGGPLMCA